MGCTQSVPADDVSMVVGNVKTARRMKNVSKSSSTFDRCQPFIEFALPSKLCWYWSLICLRLFWCRLQVMDSQFHESSGPKEKNAAMEKTEKQEALIRKFPLLSPSSLLDVTKCRLAISFPQYVH